MRAFDSFAFLSLTKVHHIAKVRALSATVPAHAERAGAREGAFRSRTFLSNAGGPSEVGSSGWDVELSAAGSSSALTAPDIAGQDPSPMRLLHVALVRSSEAASDRFFQEILGLDRTRTKTVPAELCAPLFGRAEEHRLVYYGNGHLEIEVFLSERPDFGETFGETHLGHVCLEVDDAGALLARCAAAGIEVRRVERGSSSVIFIADEDGNLFEIKERA